MSFDRATPSRPGRRAAAVIALAAALTIAAAPNTAIRLEDRPDGARIVRCHFDEGRIVVRHGERLHVLHRGDTIAEAGLRVVEITADSAFLTLQARDGGGARLLRIAKAGGGSLAIRELATRPDLLSTAQARTHAIAASAVTVPVTTQDPD